MKRVFASRFLRRTLSLVFAGFLFVSCATRNDLKSLAGADDFDAAYDAFMALPRFDSADAAVSELKSLSVDFLPLISDAEDRGKLKSVVDSVIRLSKNPCEKDEKRKVCTYEGDGERLEVGYIGGAYKGAFGNYVKAHFYYRGQGINVHLYLTEGDFDVVACISGGGKRENVQGAGSIGSEWQPDYDPDRSYGLNSRTSYVKSVDFYWD